MQTHPKLTLGISSCLIGEEVRFNGGHKREAYITDTLASFVDFIPVCPEVAIGMSVPRPALHLIGESENPQLVYANDHAQNFTTAMQDYSKQQVKQFPQICGYIVKNKSPTCGMERVRVYQGKGSPTKSGVGIYTRELQNTNPLLPIEEEGRLKDPFLRENFIERIYAYQRWLDMMKNRITAKILTDFHAQHKLILMAHNIAGYQRCGNIAANINKGHLKPTAQAYIREFMQTLQYRATHKRHTNVLQHLLGYLSKQLSSEDKQELLNIIEQYRNQQLPLIVPITLFKHYFRIYPNDYIKKQLYLNPHPDELKLRNHV